MQVVVEKTVQEVAEILGVKPGTVHKWTQMSRDHTSGKRYIRDPFPDPIRYAVDRPVYDEYAIRSWARRTRRVL